MSVQLLKKAASFSVAISLLTCLSVPSVVLAHSLQTVSPITNPSAKLASNAPTYARTNVAKANETASTPPAPAKEVKQHDKKAISRCWSRLMTMVREVRQAHQRKK